MEWDIAFGAHERTRVIDASHESNVCQLRNATDENDVGRFHVAMHESVRLQVR